MYFVFLSVNLINIFQCQKFLKEYFFKNVNVNTIWLRVTSCLVIKSCLILLWPQGL